MKFGCSIGIFLNSAHLICRSADISKCFRGFLRLRGNGNRLYLTDMFSKEMIANSVDRVQTAQKQPQLKLLC